MSIGTTIKQLRRAKDLTQEDLAEALSITAKAVSQWECDRTSPDISQLPALCHLFDITSDQLLGIDISAKMKKIDELTQAAETVAESGDHKTSIEMWLAGIKQFPDSYRLMGKYVDEVFLYAHMTDNEREHKERALSYIDKILASCTDSQIRNGAIITACMWYPRIGRAEEALEMADRLPRNTTKNDMLRRIYKGTKKYEQWRENIMYQFTNSCCDLFDLADCKDDDGNPIYSDEEKLCLYEKQIALFKIFFEDGDYMFYSQFLECPYACMADIYAKRGETESMLATADAAADYAIQFDTYDYEGAHTSLIAKGVVAGGVWWHDMHNRTHALLEHFTTDGAYAPYRDQAAFRKIIAKLELHAK